MNCIFEGGRGGTYDSIIGTTFAAKVHGVIVVDTFVDDSVGEHGLGCDAKYEDAEGQIVCWFGIFPHIYICSKQLFDVSGWETRE